MRPRRIVSVAAAGLVCLVLGTGTALADIPVDPGAAPTADPATEAADAPPAGAASVTAADSPSAEEPAEAPSAEEPATEAPSAEAPATEVTVTAAEASQSGTDDAARILAVIGLITAALALVVAVMGLRRRAARTGPPPGPPVAPPQAPGVPGPPTGPRADPFAGPSGDGT